MNTGTVLICDDNESIHTSISSYLQDDRISVISVYKGEDAIDIVSKEHVDVIILDIMLPGIDGFETCKRIRKLSAAHIIMLSAKSSENDRILGLEIGADDYIIKPFSPREIGIRIKKALERNNPEQVFAKLTLAELTVYPSSGQVFIRDKEIRLSPKEVSVVIYMIRNAGKILSRDHILNAVWGYEYFGDTRVVDTMIKTLRKKLINDDVHFNIITVYGSGYRLTETL